VNMGVVGDVVPEGNTHETQSRHQSSFSRMAAPGSRSREAGVRSPGWGGVE
jgi:hypothetical protein